jgi:hypothetical protein
MVSRGSAHLEEAVVADDGKERWSDVRVPLIAVGIVVAIPAIATAISQAGGPFPQFDELAPTAQGLVGLGIWGCVAVAVLTIGLIVCAEIRARAVLDSAKTRPAGPDPVTRSGGSNLWAVVRGHGTDPWLVVSVRRVEDQDWYLLARDDADPAWVTNQEVTSWRVTGP